MAMKNPDRVWAKANNFVRSENFSKAKKLCFELLKEHPSNTSVLFMLGYCERKLKNHPKALRYLNAALQKERGNAEILFQLANFWDDLGNYPLAEQWYRETLKCAPQKAEAWNGLGSILEDKEEALRCLKQAIESAPNLYGAYFNMAAKLFDENDLALSKDLLEHTVKLFPDFTQAYFYLGVIYWLMNDPIKSESYLNKFRNTDFEYLIDNFDYIMENRTDQTRFFGTTNETLKFAAQLSPPKGLYLEFGVNYGRTIRVIASSTERVVHGFDSFDGLPDDWGDEKKGSYSTYGELPDVPPNVVLHKGWFSETLPPFLDSESATVAFANIDCDLYSSTKDIFRALEERIVKGSVLVFDEYLFYPQWQKYEYKAFKEFISDSGNKYEYLAFGVFSKQAVVRIT
ncbi:MAG: tetratricopeptide repeat protein [Methyloligellaceae bacterium]